MTYEDIYTAYREKVLAYLAERTGSPEQAEDICEDVFEQIGRSLPRYDAKKASLSTWIYRITRFTLIDYLRTRHPTEPLDEELGYEADYDEALIKEETLEKLASALEALDREMRNLIILRYYRKKTLTEISRITGVSYGMVRVIYTNARWRSCAQSWNDRRRRRLWENRIRAEEGSHRCCLRRCFLPASFPYLPLMPRERWERITLSNTRKARPGSPAGSPSMWWTGRK